MVRKKLKIWKIVSLIIMCGGILSPTGLAPKWIYFITFYQVVSYS